MYKLLLVLASAQAPGARARWPCRGGEIDPITIGKGVVLASGIYGAFDPTRGNLDKYGIKAEEKGGDVADVLGADPLAAALNLDALGARPNAAYGGLDDGHQQNAMAWGGGRRSVIGRLHHPRPRRPKWVATSLGGANGAQCSCRRLISTCME